MNFSHLCIHRPAFTIVLSLIITLLGIISFNYLPLRWIPAVNPPIVAIMTSYPGASANLIENQVTSLLEASLSGVDGIETIASKSMQGESEIMMTFKLGHHINAAIENIRSATQQIELPLGVKPPVIEKADPNSEPILYLSFSDQQHSANYISDYIRQFIKPRLETIDGVANIIVFGERESALRIWLDPAKMSATNVSVDDIDALLKSQNIQLPSGQIRSTSRFYTVVTDETLKSVDEFNNLIIRNNQNQIVRLKDVGNAVIDALNTDSQFRVHGQPAIALGIIPQSTANPLTVSHAVLKEFNQLNRTLPVGMKGDIVFNQATFIESSIQHVYQALFEAIILVAIVIFLFLANWRAAFIPIITIPVCLISVFTVLYFFKLSINTITLMALVLAIGLVVDDAIVMLENMIRHIEAGESPWSSALKGSREITFPIIAMTLTLVAVYLPIAFTGGMLGAVFAEFATTLASAVLISGFVALTLSPMMGSRLLRSTHTSSRYSKWINDQFCRLQTYYQSLLKYIFNHRRWVGVSLIMTSFIGIALYSMLPAELAPLEDMNGINVFVSAPRDASAEYTDSIAQQLEKIYQKIPEIQLYWTEVGLGSPSQAFQFVSLIPYEKRKRHSSEIAFALTQQAQSLVGARISVSPMPPPLAWFGGGEGSSVAMEIMSSIPYKNLNNLTQQVVDAAQKRPDFSYVNHSLRWDSHQFDVKIDREKAAAMKVPMQNITTTISTLLAGRNEGYFEYEGNQYNIFVQMERAKLADTNSISQLYVRNENNNMVPLSDLVTVQETTSPHVLPHFSRLRSDTLFATLSPGYTIADAVKTLTQLATQLLPENVKFTFEGEAANYLESSHKIMWTFLLAIIFIYLVLVAQFESFIDPFVILLTVPFALVGALLMLKLAGGTLNIYSNIGLVTLIGLIAKHGILITEFANHQKLAGKGVQEAVIEAAKLRLRPILMTTAAMILGAIPLALASGPGAENRHQIGWVIVGGLLLGTFFSLFVVPVAYVFFSRKGG